jgi:hypothetical protein
MDAVADMLFVGTASNTQAFQAQMLQNHHDALYPHSYLSRFEGEFNS